MTTPPPPAPPETSAPPIPADSSFSPSPLLGATLAGGLGSLLLLWPQHILVTVSTISLSAYGISGTSANRLPIGEMLLLAVPTGLLIGLGALRLSRIAADRPIKTAVTALAPALGLLPLCWGKPTFGQLCLGLLLWGFTILRGAGHFFPAIATRPPLPRWFAALSVLGLSGILVWFATWFQLRVLANSQLSYSDWGIYTEVALNTLRGKWFLHHDLGGNYLGHHFLPGAIAILLPVVALKSHLAVFLLNSLALYGGGILLYLLSRELRLARTPAALLAGAYLLHPALSNMSYAIGYGFHTIYLAMPLVVGVFLLNRRGWRRLALAIWLFSLTINETVGIFWAGAAMGQALSQRGAERRRWALLAGGSLLYSAVVMAWVIPAISGRPSYDFISRYAQLGGSYLEIFLSPILRPRVFFSTLFRPEVGFYLCLLLAPVIWLTALQPWALLAGSLVIAGVCLQQSRQSMILPLQYHSEYLAYVYVLAVFGAARLQHGPPVSGWVRRWWFLEKSEAGDSSRLVLVATFAVFAGSALGFLWFSLAPFSRNSLRFLPQAPPLAPHLAEFDRLIPPDTELTVSPFLASHYAFRNLVYYPSAKLCDWVLLDLGERIRYEAQRRQLLCSPDYQCLAVKSCGRSFLMLFARGKAERPPPPPVIAPEAWTDAGFGLPPGQWREPDIACRIRPERKMDGRLRLTIALRLERQFDHDFDLLLDQGGAAPDRKVVLLPFGNGLWPAYLLPPGATWSFTVDDLPPDAAVALQVRHKPPP